jgi:hypothetical protein
MRSRMIRAESLLPTALLRHEVSDIRLPHLCVNLDTKTQSHDMTSNTKVKVVVVSPETGLVGDLPSENQGVTCKDTAR